MTRITSGLGLLFSISAASWAAQGPSPEAIFEQANPSVLVVETDTGSVGSGFVFDTPNTIVTCYHVVEGAKKIQVKNNSGTTWDVVAVRLDESTDIAVLTLWGSTGLKPLRSNPYPPKVGQRAYVIGTPLGILTNTLSEGLVSGVRSAAGVPLVQFSASISPGSSGGPVLDNQGHVIGVVSFTFSKGQSLNLAVGVQAVKKALYLPPATLVDAADRGPLFPEEHPSEAEEPGEPIEKMPGALARVPSVGETVLYELRVQFETSGYEATLTGMIEEKVIELDENGRYAVQSLEREMKLVASGEDLNVPPTEPNETRYDAKGQILSLKIEDEYRFANLRSFRYPLKVVEVGDRWVAKVQPDAERNVEAATLTYVVEGFEKVGTWKTVRVRWHGEETTGSLPTQAQGVYWLEFDTGIIVRFESFWQNVPFKGGFAPVNAKIRFVRQS